MSTKKSAKSKSINESNNNLVDLLDEDTPIAGQKFVCLSFISPEDIINDKKLFYFEKFINQYDFTKSINKFSEFLRKSKSEINGYGDEEFNPWQVGVVM